VLGAIFREVDCTPITQLVIKIWKEYCEKFGKSTVLDSAKPFGQICFFYFYLVLSIFPPRVRLKERVVAL
jgi:hypothetical protein